MHYRPENPLVVQSDHTLMLETMGPHFDAARDQLARFAELVKSPEYLHTWRITPLSLWNAAAVGVTADAVVQTLERWSKYPVPSNVPTAIREAMGRYGRLVLTRGEGGLVLRADDALLMLEVRRLRDVAPLLGAAVDDCANMVAPGDRGPLKQALVKTGRPVDDRAGYRDGASLAVALRPEGVARGAWAPRPYQQQAASSFLGGTSGSEGGSGVVVLPCGAGKTIVGIDVLCRLGMKTLILGTNVTALRQWRDELLDKTTLLPEDVGEYTGHSKDICPVTLSTYQMLTWRATKDAEFVHFGLFDAQDWGLVIYDEVHLLPAPVFRTVAHLQARRRLGLTATLVREDGHQDDVFALIGPKRFDMPWKDLEQMGWIATAQCVERRLPLTEPERIAYATADDKEKFRLASTSPTKLEAVAATVAAHAGERILVIGMYVAQLEEMAAHLGAPLITGKTKQAERDALYASFREGHTPVLVVSKVGNFSVDLPDASVAIQVSGTWGSRQEEAQRLGRVLRPKADGRSAWFYTLVSRDTVEQDYAERRQLFLTEQGYAYRIESA
jgi:DNA excision repair protein ERCC-3